MLQTNSIEELILAAGDGPISSVVLEDQAEHDGDSPEALVAKMLSVLEVMRTSIDDGLSSARKSVSGMTGGQGALYMKAVREGKTASGPLVGRACARALAVAESNAAMGRIVAAPTAGACGVLPGVLFTRQEEYGFSDRALALALFTASGIGSVIAQRASVSGAQSGCQAEVGAASAMAAAAVTELRGGNAEACASAAALALMNVMGLVCDPVAGLVEVPCVYRNVMCVSNALSAADMALSGIRPFIPADEVIDAMGQVGRQMPTALRETGEGGCAGCPSARKMRFFEE